MPQSFNLKGVDDGQNQAKFEQQSQKWYDSTAVGLEESLIADGSDVDGYFPVNSTTCCASS